MIAVAESSFDYPWLPTAPGADLVDGTFWVTELHATTAVSSLVKNTKYAVRFVIQDNGAYDQAKSTTGTISDPFRISSGAADSDSGNGGGTGSGGGGGGG